MVQCTQEYDISNSNFYIKQEIFCDENDINCTGNGV